MELKGCGTALVTPFRADGCVDEDALRALVEWQITSGVRMLVACGTTGETPSLTDEEWERVIRITVEAANKRVPVIAGCTHNATREAVSKAKAVAKMDGVNAILSASPYYNKPTQEGQYQHFRAIADASGLPVVLYNVPGRTAANLEPATIARLAEHGNIIGVKESSGSLQQITEVVHAVPETFAVIAGDDNIALAAIAVGARGLISVASNEIPAETSAMVDAALNNNWEEARRINQQYYKLFLANFWESNPIPVKCLLAHMGRIAEVYRLPLTPPSTKTRCDLEKLADELGLPHKPFHGHAAA